MRQVEMGVSKSRFLIYKLGKWGWRAEKFPEKGAAGVKAAGRGTQDLFGG